MRRAFVAVTLLLAVGGAYAAGAFGGSPSLRTDIRLTRHFACLDANRHRVDRRTLRRFHAVTAVYCSEGQRVYPGQGQWEVLVRKVAVSSVAGLQRYYEQPDQRDLPKKGRCFDNLIGLAIPAFVDAHGRWVTPVRWPEDGCGHPLGFGVGHGPPAVRWHVVRVHRIKQLISAAAVAANCPMRWGNTVAWAGPPRDSSRRTALPRRPENGAHLCLPHAAGIDSPWGTSSAASASTRPGPAGCSGRSPVPAPGAAARSSARSQSSAKVPAR